MLSRRSFSHLCFSLFKPIAPPLAQSLFQLSDSSLGWPGHSDLESILKQVGLNPGKYPGNLMRFATTNRDSGKI